MRADSHPLLEEVPGRTRLRGHQRSLVADEAIEQRALARVGPTHDDGADSLTHPFAHAPRREELPDSRPNRFKPGHQPWNKGENFDAGGRSKETQFKPGQKPHTWKPIGTLRISGGQLERKTSERKGANHMRWTPVARLVWEAANGPAPAGHLVVFKPGTKTTVLEEITLDRLECISRGENGRRNVAWNSQPETAPLVHLRGQIQRQVNRICREDEEPTGKT
jgi:hypothetical protein